MSSKKTFRTISRISGDIDRANSLSINAMGKSEREAERARKRAVAEAERNRKQLEREQKKRKKEKQKAAFEHEKKVFENRIVERRNLRLELTLQRHL
ncbi:hypothetical protein QUF70_14820 [Desulfobacterales bacterium HSG17]|nr:hypothetical protein [Desulfobacterales bacterium HSG17]